MTATKDWRADSACREEDPDLFFPVAGEGTPAGKAQYAEAKTVCARCPVRADCLAYALDSGLDDGVFGGTTPDERRQLLKNRVGTAA